MANIERLKLLGDFLRTIPPKRFHMNIWAQKPHLPPPEDLSCNTAACALGWATLIPEFRELGLELRPDESEAGFGAVWLGERYGTEAATALFDLSKREADVLFIYGPNDPIEFADRIDRFIEHGV